MSSIRFEAVSKSYDEQVVLKEFSTEVRPGELKIVLGGSGSGKSTILKMVVGLIRPDSGSLKVSEEDVIGLNEEQLMGIRSQIGMVFQEGALFDSLTVGENVAYRLREQGKLTEQQILDEVERTLGFVGLERTINRMPSQLSGGMRRRVAIARALVGNPKIMLYDEPTAGLDPITGRTICELVMRLRDIDRVTSIFVTHDLKAAWTMATETAFMAPNGQIDFSNTVEEGVTTFIMIEKGRTALEGSREDLLNSDNSFIREFLD